MAEVCIYVGNHLVSIFGHKPRSLYAHCSVCGIIARCPHNELIDRAAMRKVAEEHAKSGVVILTSRVHTG